MVLPLGALCPLAACSAHDEDASVSGGSWAQTAVATLERDGNGPREEPHAVGSVGEPEQVPRLAGRRTGSRKLGVLVGSDDPFTRQAFRRGARSPGIEVLAEGTVLAVAEQLAGQLEPDIVLLDVQTAAAQALQAIQQIHASVPGTPILACSAPAGIEFGLLCLSAGAWGYLSKEIDLAAMPRILRALADGEAVIPRAMATELVRRFAKANRSHRLKPAELSAPECRLLDLLRTGFTLPAAAAELGITLATARRHFASARRKLSVPPRASNPGAGGGRHRNHQLEVS